MGNYIQRPRRLGRRVNEIYRLVKVTIENYHNYLNSWQILINISFILCSPFLTSRGWKKMRVTVVKNNLSSIKFRHTCLSYFTWPKTHARSLSCMAGRHLIIQTGMPVFFITKILIHVSDSGYTQLLTVLDPSHWWISTEKTGGIILTIVHIS